MDTRYQCEHVTTHAGDQLPCLTSDKLLPLLNMAHLLEVDVIAVDEAQFFPDLVSHQYHIIILCCCCKLHANFLFLMNSIQVEFVTCVAEEQCRTVIVAGLDGDFKRRRFGHILDLVPLADSVTKLSGKCHFCDDKSLFSLRVAADDRQELIGGADKYVPTCRHHYVQLSNTRQLKF